MNIEMKTYIIIVYTVNEALEFKFKSDESFIQILINKLGEESVVLTTIDNSIVKLNHLNIVAYEIVEDNIPPISSD